MCLLVSAVLLGCLMPVGLAQSATGSNAGSTLATVKLSAAIRSKIEQVVFEDLNLREPEIQKDEALTPIHKVNLGPGSRWVWEVTAPQDHCGSHEKCVSYLFDPVTGAPLIAEEDENAGQGIQVLNTWHHGWRDFMISGNVSVCQVESFTYQFDGHTYHVVRTVEDTSACGH